ncbi:MULTISPECIES: HlyD family secretion protein [unclassified Pseudoalteromonas]|uniref:HlyD family secretion protein n=1 Tax=unclassified Pseudoalteromonas TaxID=194690 RepID=UPI001F3CD462|nr:MULTISPECIES: HlyD family efflux transporter periplasmic adaptor subunit [unclassified Pseudoalteromonas]MCF2828706.1 HlyD family efflux transporter periplasmic adaptor subunit [Pseudoalteromonas sp. OF5H-5]MCF2833445.1 HlyD family efflux transporter periplasmic adaptor subunit [Pseudoalteromonas sp. DL2-H6]MCF2925122.1 HlyD family efflux transporter periplasmic adaptor subunit [Pseudoalteromonas sp. DL2-H1]
MSDLFRKEALLHQGHKLDGEVTLATHMSFNWILGVIVLIVVIGCAYLFLGEYHRKEVVSGYLRPTQGVSKIYPLGTGVVDRVLVEEGQSVKKGEVLATIRMERVLTSGADMNAAIVTELEKQKQLLQENLANQIKLRDMNQDKLESQIASLSIQLEKAKNQLRLLSERVALSDERVKNTEALITKGFASGNDLKTQKDNLLAITQQQEELLSRLSSQREQMSQLQYELAQLPIDHRETQVSLQSQLASINQQIRQAQGQQSYNILSQMDGKVSNLLVKPGMVANGQTPIMTVLPHNAELEAILFVPTRAYGFVKPEQLTRIRYQAFPYQRFGIYEGHINTVSKSILLPNEANAPVSLREPVYQVVVSLKSQSANAYGATVPLQAGMLLEADIMVDSRSLFEWLFEPIYSIKGAL